MATKKNTDAPVETDETVTDGTVETDETVEISKPRTSTRVENLQRQLAEALERDKVERAKKAEEKREELAGARRQLDKQAARVAKLEAELEYLETDPSVSVTYAAALEPGEQPNTLDVANTDEG